MWTFFTPKTTSYSQISTEGPPHASPERPPPDSQGGPLSTSPGGPQQASPVGMGTPVFEPEF